MINQKTNHKPQEKPNNWYAKLHPTGVTQHTKNPKRLLNLSIFFRVWLAVTLVLIICGVVTFTQLFSYIKPTAQQVIEDTLLDTSKMMAVNLQQPLQSGQLLDESYQRQLDSAFMKVTTTNSRTVGKTLNNDRQVQSRQQAYSSFRLYVTSSKGMVIYDSLPAPDNAEGKDYSRWNDVYLTLKGQYGARSTADNSSKYDSSVMYVAQPIQDSSGSIIGVVSVGKPIASVLPYLDNTRRRMLITALLMSIVALILAGLVAWWLKQSITLVTRYTSTLAEETKKPYFYLGNELNGLTDTIETMKHRLENRAYVTDYVHTLTHELKSPLTAIRASSELLEDNGLDSNDRHILNQSIGEQSIKMQVLIDRLLLLAKVEQPTFKLNRQPLSLLSMLQSLVNDSSANLQQQQLLPIDIHIDNQTVNITTAISSDFLTKTTVYADSFWLIQALQNILDNAIYFADNIVTIHIDTTVAHVVTINIFNDGQILPEYAVAKVFDRYFSLSHQSSQPEQANAANFIAKKGTGLGLTLVKQVIEHHGGHIALNNIQANPAINQSAGVVVSITLPLAER